MTRKTVTSRAKTAAKLLGKSTKGNGGGKKRSKAKTTIKPTGNPLKGKIGVRVRKTF